MNLWLIWFIAGIVFLIIEIFTPAFVSSVIGISCILTGVVSLIIPKSIFPYNILIQVIFFSLSLLFLMLFIRPIFLKFLTKKTERKSNLDVLIGKEVLVESEIDNIKEKGYIKVGADYFRARSLNINNIKKNDIVRIIKFEGNTAIVEKLNKK